MMQFLPEFITRGLRRRRFPGIIRSVKAEALTYLEFEALDDLFRAIVDLEEHNLSGVIIEAGCALGGSAIVMASAKRPLRRMYVYDVFGMIPPPSEQDGPDVHDRYETIRSGRSSGIDGHRYYGYEEDLLKTVRGNFERLGVVADANNVLLMQGLFQDTLHVQEAVALAHVDGDWYDSVMTCLQRITPYLEPGGRIVIDDYDSWSGCRKAVDEYFSDKRDRYMFVRKSRLHIVRMPT